MGIDEDVLLVNVGYIPSIRHIDFGFHKSFYTNNPPILAQ